MITIITGIPGMGKTALVVSMMMKELEKGERPFFVMGIPDLKLDHSPVPPVAEWTEKRPDKDDATVLLDYYTFPPNSIIIIDEAQRVFRPRASSSKVPPHVAAQETHRHTGVDFWLMTQKPMLIDSNIRELCGRHIHLKPTLMGRYLYEWSEYNDVNSKVNLSDAIKRKFSPPAEAFSNYKSSELHTKQPKRFHQVWILLFLAFLTIGYFAQKLYFGLYTRMQGTKNPVLVSPDLELQPKRNDNLIDAVYTPKDDAPKQVQNTTVVEPTHPYKGFDFVISGTVKSARFTRTYFELSNGEKSVFTNDIDLKKLGYSITQNNDCSAFLFFNGAQVVATCSKGFASSDFLQRSRGLSSPDNVLDVPPRPLIDSSELNASPDGA